MVSLSYQSFLLQKGLRKNIKFKQARSHGVANATPGDQKCNLFATPENFLGIIYCCFDFVAKERYSRILTENNLGLCSIQENSILSYIHFIHLIVIT